jgi:chromosome segregation ATPase
MNGVVKRAASNRNHSRDYYQTLPARLTRQTLPALDAGLAQQWQAQTQVQLTRANTGAVQQQARAGVQQSRTGEQGARAGAAAERSRTNQAAAAVVTAQANLQQARAQLSAAEAEATRANADMQRYQELFSKDEISRQRLDEAIATARTANAQVDAAREKVSAAEAQVAEARSAEKAQSDNARRAETQVGGAQAQVSEAMGRLAQANTAPQQIAVKQLRPARTSNNSRPRLTKPSSSRQSKPSPLPSRPNLIADLLPYLVRRDVGRQRDVESFQNSFRGLLRCIAQASFNHGRVCPGNNAT